MCRVKIKKGNQALDTRCNSQHIIRVIAAICKSRCTKRDSRLVLLTAPSPSTYIMYVSLHHASTLHTSRSNTTRVLVHPQAKTIPHLHIYSHTHHNVPPLPLFSPYPNPAQPRQHCTRNLLPRFAPRLRRTSRRLVCGGPGQGAAINRYVLHIIARSRR
jgi:hypothetical protein